jgi:hypothetical protein
VVHDKENIFSTTLITSLSRYSHPALIMSMDVLNFSTYIQHYSGAKLVSGRGRLQPDPRVSEPPAATSMDVR